MSNRLFIRPSSAELRGMAEHSQERQGVELRSDRFRKSPQADSSPPLLSTYLSSYVQKSPYAATESTSASTSSSMSLQLETPPNRKRFQKLRFDDSEDIQGYNYRPCSALGRSTGGSSHASRCSRLEQMLDRNRSGRQVSQTQNGLSKSSTTGVGHSFAEAILSASSIPKMIERNRSSPSVTTTGNDLQSMLERHRSLPMLKSECPLTRMMENNRQAMTSDLPPPAPIEHAWMPSLTGRSFSKSTPPPLHHSEEQVFCKSTPPPLQHSEQVFFKSTPPPLQPSEQVFCKSTPPTLHSGLAKMIEHNRAGQAWLRSS